MTLRLRQFGRVVVPPVAAYVLRYNNENPLVSSCEEQEEEKQKNNNVPKNEKVAGMQADAQGDFHGMFPKRQLWEPKVPYPLWDSNWDGKRPMPTGDEIVDRERERELRRNGVTRHIILIRHGQYDETHKADEKRILTPLGREQAEATGRRLAEMMNGINEEFDPCHMKVIRVSNLTRAKETADIISKYIPGAIRASPDSDLNEGRPSHYVPGGKATSSVIAKTDEGHERIERAFRKYVHRAPSPSPTPDDTSSSFQPQSGENEVQLQPNPKHEFEIIVCHANVIRYFLCRALQLPPEAWLRLCVFNCSLTYVTVRPTGGVSCRMVGDIGHLGYDKSTFSMHHGYNW